jgi:hypothetical protein
MSRVSRALKLQGTQLYPILELPLEKDSSDDDGEEGGGLALNAQSHDEITSTASSASLSTLLGLDANNIEDDASVDEDNDNFFFDDAAYYVFNESNEARRTYASHGRQESIQMEGSQCYVGVGVASSTVRNRNPH